MALRTLCVFLAFFSAGTALAGEPTRDDVVASMKHAVAFFRDQASSGGGYVFQISSDLSKREGEGKVGTTTAWIEPPATPSVGLAYLSAYRLCRESVLLDAAQDVANALVQGQLRSGGWGEQVEFEANDRKKYAYRVEPNDGKRNDITTFDDDKSQSAIRFLMQLDRTMDFKDPVIHEAVKYALDAVLQAQYPNGAWPQKTSGETMSMDPTIRKATFPEYWSRTHPREKYTKLYTLNDNTMSDLIVTLLDAWDIYGDRRYLKAAERGGDFFLLAQLPEPQPGWAQQYDHHMHPTWARKFEPPAVSGSESQVVMRTLLKLYRRVSGAAENTSRFIEPLPRAIAYYRRSQLPDGRLARFYEIVTNRPLYFNKQYELTYSSDEMPTHYGFIVDAKLDGLEAELEKVQKTPKDKLWNANAKPKIKRSKKLDAQVRQIVGDLDSRGAWVEPGRMRHHGAKDSTRKVIRSDTFSNNLVTLASWLAAE